MTDTNKILIVSTSADQMDASGNHETGLWLEELTAPYYTFADAGNLVTVASIKGGKIPLDARSLGDLDESGKRYYEDSGLQEILKTTQSVDQYSANDFDAIFLPGGHGTVADFPENETLANLISEFEKQGKVIGAVCHGPTGLARAVKADGSPLVKDRKVTGFSNSEEVAVGLEEVVPFLLEDKLKELGGKYERGDDWTAHGVRDGNLVTGQNPQSSKATADLVLEALKEKALTEA